jgi:hypothetical protein
MEPNEKTLKLLKKKYPDVALILWAKIGGRLDKEEVEQK